MDSDEQRDESARRDAAEEAADQLEEALDEGVVDLINEDVEIQGSMMRLLLIEHPVQLTTAELERELFRSDGEHEVEIEDAAARLAAVGLVHRHGSFVIPSRAALYYDSLSFD